MKIEHVAIWVRDLEKMKRFYEQYFDGKSNDKYYNATKGFQSYFITFEDGARLEVMRKTGIEHSPQINITGWAHVAFSVGSKALVNEKTEQLMHAGYEVVSQPRMTGDGYYESVIKDPEGNLIEISM